MVKKILTVLLFTTVLLFSVGCTKNNGSENPENIVTEDLFTLINESDMCVSIRFDVEPPLVAFIAPDETVFNETNIRFEVGAEEAKYYLPNSMPGIWQIAYDKKSNKRFEITYANYLDSVTVSDFTMGKVDGDYLPVNFTVESKIGGTCGYRITAFTADEENRSEILLADGSSNMNTPFYQAIDISNLTDGGYKLRLDVTLKYGEEVVTDSKIAESYILTIKQKRGD